MPGNGKIFISHAHADNDLCRPIAKALDEWGADFWIDLEDLPPGGDIISTIEMELEDRDVFLCIGTPAWSSHFYTQAEFRAFFNLMAQDHDNGERNKRAIICLKMTPDFKPPLLMGINLYIDATSEDWLTKLRNVVGSQPRGPVAPRDRYRAFFQSVMDALAPTGEIGLPSKPNDRNWCSFASGFSGLSLSVVFPEGNKVRTELYIGRGENDQAKAIFDALMQSQAAIEAEFGEPLTWERLNHRKASRIAIYRPGSITDDQAKLNASRDWAADHLLRFKRVFTPRLTQILGAQ